MSAHLAIESPDPTSAAPFRYRRVGDRYLLTNPAGQYAFVTPEELRGLVEGTLDHASPTYQTLAQRNFIQAELDVGDLAERLRQRKLFLTYGPHLHIVEVTLRCNQTCVYCHSSRAPMDATDKDMSPETAERVLDLIFETSSPAVTIEFQGGEPLANFPVVTRIIEGALARNESKKKQLEFSLVSNLSLLDPAKLDFLMRHRVQICTSIDGPPALHNKQRHMPGSDGFAVATDWVRRINAAYATQGLNPEVYHVEGLLTTTREALAQPREIVDTYVELGFRALFLRPTDPFGFAHKRPGSLVFDVAEYLDFYRRAVDYMIELNRAGKQILERYAAIFLMKILKGEEPNYLDMRSPCGAGIGQIAYSADGKIFTCDEARMLYRMGDSFFQLGEVRTTSYGQTIGHPLVRALVLASNLDGSPDCSACAYNPYCGICPVVNYATQGSLHGQQRTSAWCATHMGVQDYLFGKIRDGDPAVMEIFERWATVRPRDHFLHGGGASR